MSPVEIYPVVHINNPSQAVNQSEIAFEAGADGVYLIQHGPTGEEDLIIAYQRLKHLYSERFIGVNFLSHSSSAQSFLFLELLRRVGLALPDGLWVDDATRNANLAIKVRNTCPGLQHINYLGGVAFKYTRYFTDDPLEAAAQATLMAPYVDVVTTTGPGTGRATTPAKLAAMKAVLGEKPLAVASGVSIDNIESFKPFVDKILVSTSIETTPHSGIFDKSALSELIKATHA